MYTHPHGFTRSKMAETASTWISREECNYLANVNYKLVVQMPAHRTKSMSPKQKNISTRLNWHSRRAVTTISYRKHSRS